MRTIDEMARIAPNDICPPQATSVHARTVPGAVGYVTLTCTDCLRNFTARIAHELGALAGTAVCYHCEACVPFLVESSSGMKCEGRAVSGTTPQRALLRAAS